MEEMLGHTIYLLREDVAVRKDRLDSISIDGRGITDGDSRHSTELREHHRAQDLAQKNFRETRDLLAEAIAMSPPSQNLRVEKGHMVDVRLLDDEDVKMSGINNTRVHILSKTDSKYLADNFDKLNEIVVSTDSPLGHSLLGMQRGQTKLYNGEYRVQILDSEEAISVSSLFELPEP